MSATYSDKHPHEPDIAPVLDAEGRCLICTLFVADKLVSDLHDLMYDVPLPEQAFQTALLVLEVLRAPLASAESKRATGPESA